MTNPKKMAALLSTDAATNPSGNDIAVPKLSERQRRALEILWSGPVMREALDRGAGCSNGPQLVSQLRGKGLDIHCEDVEAVDRDGRKCWPGRYSLTEQGRETLRGWGWV